MYLIYVNSTMISLTEKKEEVTKIIQESLGILMGKRPVISDTRGVQHILSRSLILKVDMKSTIFNVHGLYHTFVYGTGEHDGVKDVTKDFIEKIKDTKPTSTNVMATVSNPKAKSYGTVVKILDGSTKKDIESLRGTVGKVAVHIPRLGKVNMSADSLSDVREEVVETTTITYKIVGCNG